MLFYSLLLGETDYRFPNTTNITFPIGSEVGTIKCLTVEFVDDDIVEHQELVTFRLSAEPGVDVNPYTCTVPTYIRYSDGKPFVTHSNMNIKFLLFKVITIVLASPTTIEVEEDVGNVEICLNVTEGEIEPGSWARLYYRTYSGSAYGKLISNA